MSNIVVITGAATLLWVGIMSAAGYQPSEIAADVKSAITYFEAPKQCVPA